MRIEERINPKSLQAAMAAAGIDVLVGASSENFFYLTDTLLLSHEIIPERLCMAVMPSEGVPWALVCYCEELQTRQDSWIGEIHVYHEFQESPMEVLACLLKEQGWGRGRIGVEKRFLAGVYLEELEALLPEATVLAGDRAFDQARSLKTPQEIEILRAAALETERFLFVLLEVAYQRIEPEAAPGALRPTFFGSFPTVARSRRPAPTNRWDRNEPAVQKHRPSVANWRRQG